MGVGLVPSASITGDIAEVAARVMVIAAPAQEVGVGRRSGI